MPTYCYTAVPKKGHSRRGLIEASTTEEARTLLRQQGVLVTRLWRQQARWTRAALKGQKLASFTAQLAQLVKSSMPIYESLVALEEQCAQESYHPTLISLCNQIKGGASLSAAMGQHPRSFDTLYCAMVAAGEASGNLPMVLDQLAHLLKKQLWIKKQLVGALIYPAMIALFCTVVVYLLLTFAIPSMAALLGDRNINAFTAAVLAVSAFLSRAWPIYLPVMGLAIGSGIAALRSKKGRAAYKKALLALPVVGGFATRAALARFCRTLATLQSGGVTLIESLQLARTVLLYPTLQQEFAQAEAQIIEGSSLSTELGKISRVPRLLVRMVAVGEESGSLTPMIQQVADIYEEDLQRALGRLTALVQPIVLLVMGGIVGLIMLAVLLPLTDMSAMF